MFITFTSLSVRRQRQRRQAHMYPRHAVEMRMAQRAQGTAVGSAVQATPIAGVPTVTAVPANTNLAAELDALAQLHASGQLTTAEFEAAKAALLGVPTVQGTAAPGASVPTATAVAIGAGGTPMGAPVVATVVQGTPIQGQPV
jgi:hypothetical protein